MDWGIHSALKIIWNRFIPVLGHAEKQYGTVGIIVSFLSGMFESKRRKRNLPPIGQCAISVEVVAFEANTSIASYRLSFSNTGVLYVIQSAAWVQG